MVNINALNKRIEELINFYNETPSSFADAIGVQRSSISHIISGRNKPSLDFILKVLTAYPDVDFYWLVNGSGNLKKGEAKKVVMAPPDLFSEEIKSKIELPNTPVNKKNESTVSNIGNIERIVIFYTDGSFKNYNPNI